MLSKLVMFLFGLAVSAPAEITPYVGAIGGISTLSADAGSKLSPQGLSSSSYSPANGGALNVFAGVHLHDYFSLQANYIWNQNDLLLSSSLTGSDTFYEEARKVHSRCSCSISCCISGDDAAAYALSRYLNAPRRAKHQWFRRDRRGLIGIRIPSGAHALTNTCCGCMRRNWAQIVSTFVSNASPENSRLAIERSAASR